MTVEINLKSQPVPPPEMAHLLTIVRQYMVPSDVAIVQRACQLVLTASYGITGARSIPPLDHALAVATILAQMHIDTTGVMAGLTYEAVDARLLSLDEVEQILGLPTRHVLESMQNLNILERTKQSMVSEAIKQAEERDETYALENNKKPRLREALRRQQAETVRKMFIAMADDPRVVLLKLAYRLHAMRLICQGHYQADEQEILQMAYESREIYAPLAGRLSISRLESELLDLAFQVLEPERYLWMVDLIEKEREQWRSYVERVCGILRHEMDTIGVKADVSGRVKHVYSFYRKLVRTVDGDIDDLEHLKEAADVGQIHDLIAFRILVDSTTDCYIALGHLHALWRPKEGRIKDFIANPKPNGYRALHTTVFCLDNHLAEIQIRTHEMHELAEYGVAMHWHYKDVGDNASSSSKELLVWLRQLNEWQRDLRASNPSDSEFAEAAKVDILDEQIFVFTPKGEVKDLPVGSTPLDFAYRVHSMVGDRCAGARVTTVDPQDRDRLITRMVPLNYELQNGDIVDIVTNRSARPTHDWLNFAYTAAAKSKIRRYLKNHERDINLQIGREKLDQEVKNLTRDHKQIGIRALDQITEDAAQWVCEKFHMDDFEDVLSAIGADDLRPRAVAVKLIDFWLWREGKEPKEPIDEDDTVEMPAITVSKEPRTKEDARLQVAGVDGVLTRLANCCRPLPNDPIIGFISRGKGVIIHRADCPNVQRLHEKEQERFISVSWPAVRTDQQNYKAAILITTRDRLGLIRDIAAVIAEQGANLLGFTPHHQQGTTVQVSAIIQVNTLEQLDRIFNRIERVKDVLRVERDLGIREKK